MFKRIIVVLSLILIIEAKFLDNLDRTFSPGDNKVLEINVKLSDQDYRNILNNVQVGGGLFNSGGTDYKAVAEISISDGNEVKVFPESTFKTAGNFGRAFPKPGFNIDLSDSFMKRKSFRLRADVADISHMRQKIVCDIFNRVGLPSIQSTYVRLTINGELYGLYALLDTLKAKNIRKMYKTETDKKELKLYQCKEMGFKFTTQTANLCVNDAGDNENDISEFTNFVSQVERARSIDDLDNIMNVDLFLKTIALEWIIGSFDHALVLGHNFYFYKNEINNKWDILLYDFDNTLGQGASDWAWFGKNRGVTDYTKLSFKQFTADQKIFDILVNNNDTRFKNMLKEVLILGFNPTLLIDHIDDIKSYINPYVKEDYTPINGQLPGRVNKKGYALTTSYSSYESNSEYGMVSHQEMMGTMNVPGIKKFIEDSFNNVIKQYNFNKDEILSESATRTPVSFFTKVKYGIDPYDPNATIPENLKNGSCWSEMYGYPCCDKCNVLYVENGEKWGMENGDWCGISEACETKNEYCEKNEDYPCCQYCDVVYVDETGRYGFEGDWCLLKNEC